MYEMFYFMKYVPSHFTGPSFSMHMELILSQHISKKLNIANWISHMQFNAINIAYNSDVNMEKTQNKKTP